MRHWIRTPKFNHRDFSPAAPLLPIEPDEVHICIIYKPPYFSKYVLRIHGHDRGAFALDDEYKPLEFLSKTVAIYTAHKLWPKSVILVRTYNFDGTGTEFTDVRITPVEIPETVDG